jgi:hypothetical protein
VDTTGVGTTIGEETEITHGIRAMEAQAMEDTTVTITTIMEVALGHVSKL